MPRQKRDRDRWESDLLLNVVIAHMAFSNTQDAANRKKAYDRFTGAVAQLYQFVVNEESEVSEPERTHS